MPALQGLHEAVWRWRQRRIRRFPISRPVLDLIDFGKEAGHVLDVGASVGGFAMNILVRAPLMQVHCFEPNPDVLETLKRNARRCGVYKGKPRCLVNECGVGSRAEVAALKVTQFRPASSFLSISRNSVSGWPMADFSSAGARRVKVIKLADYLDANQLESVKLLKLDVQGFELEVLKGLGEHLRSVEYVVSEIQFTQLYEGAPLWESIVGFCSTYGFKPIVMDGFCFGPDGQPLQADILMQREL